LFYSELKSVLSKTPSLAYEIIFVDDGSTDTTLDQLNRLAANDSTVKVYSLSRNFGHQVALSAGLDVASGDAVVMLDSDLQHPPELIVEMVRTWREGYEVVSAIRRKTEDSTFFKRLSSKAFYWILSKLSETPIVAGAADFCLLSRKAHHALIQMPERHRFLRGMVSWIGFRRALVSFEAPCRAAGGSKYSTAKMLSLAFNAIFSFSVAPIRLLAQFGFLVIGLSFVYLGYILIHVFYYRDVVPGWSSLVFVTTFLGGTQLAFIGLIGEYLARVFEEAKNRPLYFFKQRPEGMQTAEDAKRSLESSREAHNRASAKAG
jgi:dolichol-phosphate mannosyltransferase